MGFVTVHFACPDGSEHAQRVSVGDDFESWNVRAMAAVKTRAAKLANGHGKDVANVLRITRGKFAMFDYAHDVGLAWRR